MERGGAAMEWQFVIALILIVPMILAPVIFIWYLNLGGAYAWFKKLMSTRKSEAAKKEFVHRLAK